jgi:SAM-dependent methyltransferase
LKNRKKDDKRQSVPRPRRPRRTCRTRRTRRPRRDDGSIGWDDYAPFYDWENALTLGRRDLKFWKQLSAREGGRALELGCGTGRLLIPIARAGADIIGIDRSAAMLDRARRRAARLPRAVRPPLLRGDIRALPFASSSLRVVMAPYGVLQSLVSDAALAATLAEAARVLEPGGLFGIDLVPDLPQWAEYRHGVTLRGRTAGGTPLTLIESVEQDRRRRLTIFHEQFVIGRGRAARRRRFTLTFRTLSLPQVRRRLERAGFRVDAVLGDYRGAPWDARADVWVVMARRRT